MPFDLSRALGFGAADLIALTLAIVLVSLFLARAAFERPVQRLAERTWLCMALLAAMPVVLRLALLPRHPAPVPSGADDFGYLLLADTLRHFRLANPAHPLHQFFEAVFVLQEPRYASIFPLGQGIALAAGWMIFGHPWAGVLLSGAAMAALACWMLRGWTTPGWALFGGVLAVMEFGPLCSWMNNYWGGAVSAGAGCLVFGALPRLRTGRMRYAVLLGAGLGIQVLTRPFESILLVIAIMLFFAVEFRPSLRMAGVAALAATPALLLTAVHNYSVTGQWTTMPYMLSRYQYGVPTTFTFQPNPVPHRPLTAEQQLDYDAQAIIHGNGWETPARYFGRLGERARFYRFFFYAPLYLVLPAFLLLLRERRYLWVAATLVIFALGTNLYPYFYPHYIAAVTCLFLLVSVTSLERLSRWRAGREMATVIAFFCIAQFLFWYVMQLSGAELTAYEPWDYINSGDREGRIAINEELAKAPGRQLVFVHYAPRHMFHEWIHNGADIDHERVVRACDLGPAENARLQRYFPDRKVWLLEPDALPPRLTPYAANISNVE